MMMTLGEAKAALKARIAEIKADSRYKAPAALIQINAPLALIQVNMKAQVEAYEFALQVLKKVKP